MKDKKRKPPKNSKGKRKAEVERERRETRSDL